MKVLFINKFFFLNGGSEAVLFRERDFLVNHGHHVIDFSMRHQDNLPSDYSEYFVSSVDYHEKKRTLYGAAKEAVKFVHNQEAIRNISRILAREKPQIAHLHNIYHQITPSVIPALKKAGVKVILTLHDYKLLCPSYYMLANGSICSECAGRHFYHAALRRCQDGSLSTSILLAAEAYWHKVFKHYEMVDLFLAPSRFIADLMAQNRIDRKKIVVLPNGIDTTEYKPSRIDKNYILFFGRISKVKGINTLLSAYKGLTRKLPLRIVGSGPYKEKLQMQHPDVEFIGYKSGDELKQLIAEASFSVVPSEWYENCSMSVLESMACGKPVIGSNIGGIPEQIADGTSGFLFEHSNADDLGKKMARLIQNKELRRDMGEAGRKIIERKYSLVEHCNKLAGIYEELINQ
ncbi:MAG: glycosyltransferase family 4 protein [Thermodesulfovibrionales bacterium]|jgi:glycosyltransferase involved in cell wall biosynthesis